MDFTNEDNKKITSLFFTSFPYKLKQCMKKNLTERNLKVQQAQINQYIKDKQP